jgi:hypothetical protein
MGLRGVGISDSDLSAGRLCNSHQSQRDHRQIIYHPKTGEMFAEWGRVVKR